MATRETPVPRAKPKDIVDASQTIFTLLPKAALWPAAPLAVAAILFVVVWSVNDRSQREGGPSSLSRQAVSSALPSAAIPLASSPQSTWPKIVIPAGGKSEFIPTPPGMRIMMFGSQFRNVTVYRNGNQCIYLGTACPDGDVSGNFALNEAQFPNIISYAFAPVN